LCHRIKEVEPPEYDGHAFNYFMKKYKNDLDLLEEKRN
jgi:hypothetical protein